MTRAGRIIRFAILLLPAGLVLLAGSSCTRWFMIQVTEPDKALLILDEWEIPPLEDDLDQDSLRHAVFQSLVYLDRLPPERGFVYGPYRVSVEEVRQTLWSFLTLVDEQWGDPPGLARSLRREFIWLRAAGRDLFGTVLFSGYYLPVLEGRLRPDGDFRYPIYRVPPDMLEVEIGSFSGQPHGGRLVARVAGRKVVPYYTRAEIDGGGVLEGRGLELVWLRDPVDRFFLHIQGSGRILLPQGRTMDVNYAASNGHPYVSIGKLLIEEGAIPREQMSMQAIRAYLRGHPERMDALLSSNPSYVFFRQVEGGPSGSLEVPITPGRSIATDSRLFPKAGLAFIRCQRPAVDEQGRIVSWQPFSRFVLNQDTGGGIQGAGRVDLYCGSGTEAETMAGHLRHDGSLFFLLGRRGSGQGGVSLGQGEGGGRP